jgi:thiol-disulfide isomerase/thioredoxin
MRSILIGLLIFVPSSRADQEAKPQTPVEQYEALLKEYKSAEQAFFAARKDVKTEEEWEKVLKKKPRIEDFGPRFLELAEKNPKSDVACNALVWIVGQGDGNYDGYKTRINMMNRAMDILARDHPNSDGVGRVCLQMVDYPSIPRDKFIRAIYETTTNRIVKGRACLSLAEYLKTKAECMLKFREPPLTKEQKADLEEKYGRNYLDQIIKDDPKPLLEEADKLLERVVKDYGDVEYFRKLSDGASGRTLAAVAKTDLFVLRNMSIGRVAPEIEGKDIDGNPMRLSDYRGKVVVLTFWATWCGPCMADIPHEVALVKRLGSKPFALLGVNGDEDREKVRQASEKEGITWRSWWDGEPRGPIVTQWDVHRWPTTYILDHKGTIRYKELYDEDLDGVIESLIKEAETAAKP